VRFFTLVENGALYNTVLDVLKDSWRLDNRDATALTVEIVKRLQANVNHRVTLEGDDKLVKWSTVEEVLDELMPKKLETLMKLFRSVTVADPTQGNKKSDS
jgi:hypothetical protein